MSLKYLLDTNVVSEPVRPMPHAPLVRRLRRHEDEVAIASVVWHELLFGMERLPESRRRTALEHYLRQTVLQTMPILDYHEPAAEWHARERARLVARGATPSFSDGQIAAIAVTYDLTLVTLNDADFRRFSGLRIATWR